MADRFQDRPLPDDLDRIDPRGRGPARGGGGGDGDPLAELARLIGQNDPFGGGGGGGVMGRANAKAQPQQRAPEPAPFRAPPPQQDSFDDQLSPAGGPPPWMARTPQAPRQMPLAEPDFQQPEPVHPLQRFPGEQPQAQAQYPQQQYRDEPMFDDRGRGQGQDARYDDALF